MCAELAGFLSSTSVGEEVLGGLFLVVIFVDIVVFLITEGVCNKRPSPVQDPVDSPEDCCNEKDDLAQSRNGVQETVKRHGCRRHQLQEPTEDPCNSTTDSECAPEEEPFSANRLIVDIEFSEKIGRSRMLVRPFVVFGEELLPVRDSERLVECHALGIRQAANQTNRAVVTPVCLRALARASTLACA